MGEMSLADLTPKELAEIRALEQKLGGVCLLAVEKTRALFALEAKLAPNEWAPVHKTYPEITNLKSYYDNREDAHLAKTSLKNLLSGNRLYAGRKRPIRIREIEHN